MGEIHGCVTVDMGEIHGCVTVDMGEMFDRQILDEYRSMCYDVHDACDHKEDCVINGCLCWIQITFVTLAGPNFSTLQLPCMTIDWRFLLTYVHVHKCERVCVRVCERVRTRFSLVSLVISCWRLASMRASGGS